MSQLYKLLVAAPKMSVLFFNLADTLETSKIFGKTAGIHFLNNFLFFLADNYYFCCLSCH